MVASDRGQPVLVSLGECRCPVTPPPHPRGDEVYLRPRPNTTMRFAIMQAVAEVGDDSRLLTGYMVEVYLRTGPVSWNLVDENNRKVDISALGEALGFEREIEVANRASDIYTEAITGPLVKSEPSGPDSGPTESSTSLPSLTEISSRRSSPAKRAALG